MNQNDFLFVKTAKQFINIDIINIDKIVYFHGVMSPQEPAVIVKYKNKKPDIMIEFEDGDEHKEFISALESYLNEHHKLAIAKNIREQ